MIHVKNGFPKSGPTADLRDSDVIGEEAFHPTLLPTLSLSLLPEKASHSATNSGD